MRLHLLRVLLLERVWPKLRPYFITFCLAGTIFAGLLLVIPHDDLIPRDDITGRASEDIYIDYSNCTDEGLLIKKLHSQVDGSLKKTNDTEIVSKHAHKDSFDSADDHKSIITSEYNQESGVSSNHSQVVDETIKPFYGSAVNPEDNYKTQESLGDVNNRSVISDVHGSAVNFEYNHEIDVAPNKENESAVIPDSLRSTLNPEDNPDISVTSRDVDEGSVISDALGSSINSESIQINYTQSFKDNYDTVQPSRDVHKRSVTFVDSNKPQVITEDNGRSATSNHVHIPQPALYKLTKEFTEKMPFKKLWYPSKILNGTLRLKHNF